MSSNPSKKKPTKIGRSGEKPTGTVKSGTTRPVSASKKKLSCWGNAMEEEEELMYNNEKILLDQASELRAEIYRLGEENERLKAKLSKNEQVENSDNRAHLEKQLSDLKNENEDIKVTIKEKNAEILKLQKDLKDANEQNRALSKQNATDQQAQERNTNFEKELKEKDESMKELQEKCKSLQEQIDRQKSQRDDIEKRTEPTDNKLTDLTRELNEAKQKCKEAASKVEELQNQVSSREKEIQDLNRQITDGKSENEGLKEKISKLRNDEQLKSKSEEIESLRKELETLKKVLSKQNATDQQAQEENRNFEKELKEKDEAMKQLQEECKSLQEQIERQKSFKQYGEQPGSEQFKMPTPQRLPLVSDSFTESMSALSVRGPGDDDSVIVAENTEFLAEDSFTGDADEHIKDPCAVCFTNFNYSKEATHFCGECGLLGHFLCEQCLSFHKKFTAHKDVKSFVAAKYKMRDNESMKAEKQTTETLSQAVGAQLIDNNPNITDLSDENRLTELAEKYLELFDNEWVDAYEEMYEELPNEQDVIHHIYQSLLDVFDFCQKSSQEYSKSLKSCVLGLPSITFENGTLKTTNIGVTHVRQLKEMKKSVSPFLVEDVIKSYVKNRNLKLEKKPQTEKFISKCVEICWLMSSQDPPVILDTGNLKGPFDTDRYKCFTKSGKTVAFAVWPPLLLHKDGPLLVKGFAQGK